MSARHFPRPVLGVREQAFWTYSVPVGIWQAPCTITQLTVSDGEAQKFSNKDTAG